MVHAATKAKAIISKFFEDFMIFSSTWPALCKHFYGMQIAFLYAFLPFLYNFYAYLITCEDFSANFVAALSCYLANLPNGLLKSVSNSKFLL